MLFTRGKPTAAGSNAHHRARGLQGPWQAPPAALIHVMPQKARSVTSMLGASAGCKAGWGAAADSSGMWQHMHLRAVADHVPFCSQGLEVHTVQLGNDALQGLRRVEGLQPAVQHRRSIIQHRQMKSQTKVHANTGLRRNNKQSV